MTIEISGRAIQVRANGLQHQLLTYGEASGEGDVLILPGITSPAATADFVARPLADLGFRVYVPDLRGRGRTEVAPSGSYKITDFAADVDGLIELLGLRRPILIGHSLGARIAAAYAVLHGPADHAPLILVDPPLSGPGRQPYPTSRDSFLSQLRAAQQGTTADEVRRFYPKWPERELQLRAEALPSCNTNAIMETYTGFEEEDFFDHWKKVTLPAVLIRGADSPVVSPAGAAELEASNAAIPILAVADAGHMVPWDNFAGFFEALLPQIRPRENGASTKNGRT